MECTYFDLDYSQMPAVALQGRLHFVHAGILKPSSVLVVISQSNDFLYLCNTNDRVQTYCIVFD